MALFLFCQKLGNGDLSLNIFGSKFLKEGKNILFEENVLQSLSKKDCSFIRNVISNLVKPIYSFGRS